MNGELMQFVMALMKQQLNPPQTTVVQQPTTPQTARVAPANEDGQGQDTSQQECGNRLGAFMCRRTMGI